MLVNFYDIDGAPCRSTTYSTVIPAEKYLIM